MKTTSYYPVLMTADVAGTAAFYVQHLRFKPLFDSGWYVHLRSSEAKRVNLGIVAGDHETIPVRGRGQASGPTGHAASAPSSSPPQTAC